MTSRERVRKALNFEKADRIPIDLGGSLTSGIHAKTLQDLRSGLKLADRAVKLYEPMMFLGEVEQDVRDALHTDILGINNPNTMLGYANRDWKFWETYRGKYLVGGKFEASVAEDGTIFVYPGGDRDVEPSGKMMPSAFFFDPIARQDDLSDHDFDARRDYAGMYTIFNDEECRYIQQQVDDLFENTDASLFGNFFQGGFGDAFHIPCPWMVKTPGVRKLEDWIILHYDNPEYIKEFFEMQLEIALENLKLYRQAVGDKIDVIAISGTDFGTQNAMFMSPNIYEEIYRPFHVILNDWVHKNTNWKTWYHSCGCIEPIIQRMIDSGVDCLNPIQFTAVHMDLESLVEKYGGKVVFWGGAINTQWTLQFGTEEEVAFETKKNVAILNKKGGFVAAAVHNIQSNTPTNNIITFFNTINMD